MDGLKNTYPYEKYPEACSLTSQNNLVASVSLLKTKFRQRNKHKLPSIFVSVIDALTHESLRFPSLVRAVAGGSQRRFRRRPIQVVDTSETLPIEYYNTTL